VSPAETKKLFVLEQLALPEVTVTEQVMEVSLPLWRTTKVVSSLPPAVWTIA